LFPNSPWFHNDVRIPARTTDAKRVGQPSSRRAIVWIMPEMAAEQQSFGLAIRAVVVEGPRRTITEE